MPIYTKKGDKGKTSTFHGEMSKTDSLAEALGSIDELNSWVGVCRTELKVESGKLKVIGQELKRIQTNLLTIGSQLAGSKKRFKDGEIKRLERLIDRLTAEMPKLANFIYPVGELQVARAVCRRAEREIVRNMKYDIRNKNENILKYLNRLSDALFTVARWVNFKSGIKEEVWK